MNTGDDPKMVHLAASISMAIDIIEHDTSASLIAMLERIAIAAEPWGVACVTRKYLRPMTNEAFLMAVTPAMEDVNECHVYFIDTFHIYVAWSGKQKSVYLNMRNIIAASLLQQGLNIDPSVLVDYYDPKTRGDEIKGFFKTGRPAQQDDADDTAFADTDWDKAADHEAADSYMMALRATSEQVRLFRDISNQRPHRQQLHILVVEDQLFSQKLLCEILRSVRVRNNNESPFIDAVTGIQDAWKIFLKKAPDITFVDLNLTDGSGHKLARAIKEIDPSSCVVIVTANNYEEELTVARQNNVDHFVAKPYNKKQILDCVAKYISNAKSRTAKSAHHG